ncbi:MAG: hypothetical protein JWN30_555 [Bacilli bacterium]|nr:hypothetical protein [Bacilli bacterium]
MGFETMNQYLLGFLLILLLGLTAGYAIGRRAGFRQGFASGQAQDKLMLRARAYELGYCPICQDAQHQDAHSENCKE